jgi:predicted transcriptional regulator
MLRKHVDFNYRRDFTSDPVGILMEELPAMMEKKVDCIILDYLRVDGVVDGEQVYMEEVATEVMNTLGNISIEYGIPVFVFCQRNYAAEGQSKKEMKAGRMGGISDFPAIENLADLTIELTYPHSRPAERHEDPGTGTYSRDRHFIVSVAGNGSPVWVPVLADHDFQRFIERDEDHGADADSDVEFGKRVRQSERKGFIKVSRDVWEEILEIRHVPTRIVYLAMALNANYKTGRLNWSGTGLEELLSMDDSVIRRALANLEQLGLVERVGQSKRGKRREWQIVEYHDRFNNADADNFVVLARNLLDEAHAPLREDHRVFTVWVHLLFETRFSKGMNGELDVGQWPAEYKRLALDLKITVEEVKHAIQKLEDLGCIKRWIDPDWGNEVIMLPNYDCYQRMVPWPAKESGRTSDKPRTNFGRTSSNKSGRTNCIATDEPQTNHGRT